MPAILRVPKVQIALLLALIYVTALPQLSPSITIPLLLISLGSTVVFDLLFTYIRRRQLFVPWAGIVTGLIIGLLVDPAAPFYQIAAISAIAMATKNFLRISGKHVFNPAAIGLFIGGVLFSQYVTWWGASFQSIRDFTLPNLLLFVILLSPLLVSAYRMKRGYSIFSFLAVYTLLPYLSSFTFSTEALVSRLFDPTTIFFAAVMLPEPMTSPARRNQQILYGITIAGITEVLSLPAVGSTLTTYGLLPDLLIPALLLGNLLFLKFK